MTLFADKTNDINSYIIRTSLSNRSSHLKTVFLEDGRLE